jgi:hypothetical protein
MRSNYRFLKPLITLLNMKDVYIEALCYTMLKNQFTPVLLTICLTFRKYYHRLLVVLVSYVHHRNIHKAVQLRKMNHNLDVIEINEIVL